MTEPLFFKPMLQEKIWGGTKLETVFGLNLPFEKIGENWVISAHPNGVSVVEHGSFKGQGLNSLWENHPELFGYSKEPNFPLLVKILDAADHLSVQVHPDDSYGLEHEGELGKTECWYIIDAEPEAEIIFGHHAQTRQELEEMIENARWDDLLQRISVKKGDFFFVPSGTIHAIGQGILILETQQNSDTTYRVYDYDRKDERGNLRPLHIKQSIDVTTVPAITPEIEAYKVSQGDSSIITFLENEFFHVYKWDVKGKAKINKPPSTYILMTVINGHGELIVDEKRYALQMGSSCIIPAVTQELILEGTMEIIASEPGKKN